MNFRRNRVSGITMQTAVYLNSGHIKHMVQNSCVRLVVDIRNCQRVSHIILERWAGLSVMHNRRRLHVFYSIGTGCR